MNCELNFETKQILHRKCESSFGNGQMMVVLQLLSFSPLKYSYLFKKENIAH